MIAGKERWLMLPGGDWDSLEEARNWLTAQRAALDWSAHDMVKAINSVLFKSRLWTLSGGGSAYQGPTSRSVVQFEAGKRTMKYNRMDGGADHRFDFEAPDWLFWVPLAIDHSALRSWDRIDWEEANIPGYFDLDFEAFEHDHAGSGGPYDDANDLIARINAIPEDDRQYLYGLILDPERIAGIRKLVDTMSELARRQSGDSTNLLGEEQPPAVE